MTRLKLAVIEQKPKKVIIAKSWRDPLRLASDAAFAKVLTHIRKCIENGAPLPSVYYSKGAGNRADFLLQNHGIMHLHLGKWNTNELLWVVQYSDRVVWLELGDHTPFETRPPGVRLYSFHRAAMTDADAAKGARSIGHIKLEPRTKSDR